MLILPSSRVSIKLINILVYIGRRVVTGPGLIMWPSAYCVFVNALEPIYKMLYQFYLNFKDICMHLKIVTIDLTSASVGGLCGNQRKPY